MNSGMILRRLAWTIAFAWLLPHAAVLAQPHGWPCDLALQPGNAWYYQSTTPGYERYYNTADYDSMGADGSYWVHFTTRLGATGSFWYRFDAECNLYEYSNPQFSNRLLWLKPLADTGVSWIVGSPSMYFAKVGEYFTANIFGRGVRTQRMFYYFDTTGTAWWRTEENASGIGLVHSHDHYNADDLIGAVIDGVRYGITSDVEPQSDGSTNDLEAHVVDGGAAISVTLSTYRTGSVNVFVANLMGRIVAERTVEPDAVPGTRLLIPTAGLASGPYFVTARAGTEARTSRVLLRR